MRLEQTTTPRERRCAPTSACKLHMLRSLACDHLICPGAKSSAPRATAFGGFRWGHRLQVQTWLMRSPGDRHETRVDAQDEVHCRRS